MLRHSKTMLRKYAAVYVLAALVGCFWFVSEASAGKGKANPSPQGQANGVAHRVAALEAAMADTQDAIALLTEAVGALQGDVEDLQGQVADLEARVATLEAGAAAP